MCGAYNATVPAMMSALEPLAALEANTIKRFLRRWMRQTYRLTAIACQL